MDCNELNARAKKAMGFTDDDLAANRRGCLSARQAEQIQASEQQRDRRLALIGACSGAAGLVLLLINATIGLVGLAGAGVVLGIRAINRVRDGKAREGAAVDTIKGPIEVHRTDPRDNDGYEYRLWAGIKHSQPDVGPAIGAAQQVLPIDKATYEALACGAVYTVYCYRETVLAVECQAIPDQAEAK